MRSRIDVPLGVGSRILVINDGKGRMSREAHVQIRGSRGRHRPWLPARARGGPAGRTQPPVRARATAASSLITRRRLAPGAIVLMMLTATLR